MRFFVEFSFTLLPVVFQVVLRLVFSPGLHWFEYVNSSTIVIIFAIWYLVTSVKFPIESRIASDVEVGIAREEMRSILSLLGMTGLFFFAAESGLNAVIEGGAVVATLKQKSNFFFAVASLCYMGFSTWIIFFFRRRIETFYV